MLGAVKPRDTAVTNGGLIGKVTKVDDALRFLRDPKAAGAPGC